MNIYVNIGNNLKKSLCGEVIFMARKARLKASDAIFHIMCKSISEVTLFRDS